MGCPKTKGVQKHGVITVNLKQNVYHSFIKKYLFNIIRSNSIYLSLLLNCMKVKCDIILPDVSVQHDDLIDTYRLISVSIVFR